MSRQSVGENIFQHIQGDKIKLSHSAKGATSWGKGGTRPRAPNNYLGAE